ncbi:MAG: peptidoglycan editing factor PgeF [Gammaproteobacteria bacterium]|nr:peptidoglycan editing factor PgeF [Gammaproteobacteria bacterium]
MDANIILPQWSAPNNIKSIQTTRQGGFSDSPFDTFNLAEHVDDTIDNVRKNRKKLKTILPSEPKWLNQIHSHQVVDAASSKMRTDADGSFTTQTQIVSVVMTADCLPVLLCNRQGNGVAALHAGWRGLLNGILEQGVNKMIKATHCKPDDIMVWLGPAIGPKMFEVGDEVRQAFLDKSAHQPKILNCFVPSANQNKWLADIYQLAHLRLLAVGVENFSGGTHCTYTEADQFYSYRRERRTGRMASLIWIE